MKPFERSRVDMWADIYAVQLYIISREEIESRLQWFLLLEVSVTFIWLRVLDKG